MKLSKRLRQISAVALAIAIGICELPVKNAYASDSLEDNPVVTNDIQTVSGGDAEVDKEYNVKFVDADETEILAQKVKSVEEIVVPEAPVKEGYDFIGWDNDITTITELTEDLTIKAQYKLSLSSRELNKTVGENTIGISGNLPANAEIVVNNEISVENIETQIEAALNGQANVTVYDAFDIKIMTGSEKYQPVDYGETVTVTINNLSDGINENALIMHIADDNSIEQVNGTINGNSVQFTASSFSTYLIANINYNAMTTNTVTINGNEVAVYHYTFILDEHIHLNLENIENTTGYYTDVDHNRLINTTSYWVYGTDTNGKEYFTCYYREDYTFSTTSDYLGLLFGYSTNLVFDGDYVLQGVYESEDANASRIAIYPPENGKTYYVRSISDSDSVLIYFMSDYTSDVFTNQDEWFNTLKKKAGEVTRYNKYAGNPHTYTYYENFMNNNPTVIFNINKNEPLSFSDIPEIVVDNPNYRFVGYIISGRYGLGPVDATTLDYFVNTFGEISDITHTNSSLFKAEQIMSDGESITINGIESGPSSNIDYSNISIFPLIVPVNIEVQYYDTYNINGTRELTLLETQNYTIDNFAENFDTSSVTIPNIAGSEVTEGSWWLFSAGPDNILDSSFDMSKIYNKNNLKYEDELRKWIYNPRSVNGYPDDKTIIKLVNNREINSYSVTLKSRNDSGTSDVTEYLNFDGAYSIKEKFGDVKPEYTSINYGTEQFAYWTSDGTSAFDLNTVITENITLNAVYKPTYGIIFQIQQYSTTDTKYLSDSLLTDKDVFGEDFYNEIFYDMSLYSPRTGYSFDGWSTQRSGAYGDENYKIDLTTYKVTSNEVLYAIWKDTRTHVNLTFSLGGGQYNGSTDDIIKEVERGVEINISSFNIIPTKENYLFTGWYTNGSESGIIETITVTDDTCVYADYEQAYTVTFDTDGGTPVPEEQHIAVGGKVTEPMEPEFITEEIIGNFIGWFKDNVQWNFNTDIVEGNMTLVAKYEYESNSDSGNTEPDDYQIAFLSLESEPEEQYQYAAEGEKIIRPTNPIRSGYNFVGWYLPNVENDIVSMAILCGETDLSRYISEKQWDFDTDAVHSNVVMIAKWQVSAPEHEHTFSTEWSTDEEKHWHESTCGHDVVNDEGTHNESDWFIDKMPTENEEGVKHTECLICGRVIRTVTIPKIVPEITPVETTITPEPEEEITPEPELTPEPEEEITPDSELTPEPEEEITPDSELTQEPEEEITPEPELIPEPELTPEPTIVPAPEKKPVVEEEEPIYIGYFENDVETTKGAMGKFMEAMKTVTIVLSISLAAVLGILGLLLLLLAWLRKVKIQNDRNTDEYSEQKYETVYKTSVKSESNRIAELFKKSDRVWTITITEEIITDRVTDDFKVVLKKGFCNRYHGEQLIVVLDSEVEEDIKELGFTIDKEETEIKFNVNQTK